MNRQQQAWVFGTGAALAGVLAWAGKRVFSERAAEQPVYESLGEQDGVELRQYPALAVAATRVEGTFAPSVEEGFHRLAGYIFGSNLKKESFDPAAPEVLQHRYWTPEAQRLEMTAPVFFQRQDEAWRMTFVMPSEFTLESLPVPIDSRIRLEAVAPKRMAALRFSGRATEEAVKAWTAELLERLHRQRLHPVGEPLLAQYNSPLMPPFLRKNEILIEVRLAAVH
ncbi:SOUL family heme-binding protein [Stigmatella erecta]|uniref:SOUL heme-binding protein n=1 Tax=Stigmatella erecta TaxID=83460 RepID=A0A1I0KFW0_9BACT|nr:heme-binding protein [Stigmatella erecta]SEU23340.1 SOUL heme-binding protein [Stigmatella erecta]